MHPPPNVTFFNYYVLVAKQLIERAPGQVLTIGQGDVGQLGLGPDRLECTRPARVQGLSDIVYICAGGMHTVCLDVHGQVSPAYCKHLNWLRAWIRGKVNLQSMSVGIEKLNVETFLHCNWYQS